jgi:hypothetical protein
VRDKNAVLASSRLSATPPFRPCEGGNIPLCVQRHSSQPVLRIPLWRGTQIGLRLPSLGPQRCAADTLRRSARRAQVPARSVGASTNTFHRANAP